MIFNSFLLSNNNNIYHNIRFIEVCFQRKKKSCFFTGIHSILFLMLDIKIHCILHTKLNIHFVEKNIVRQIQSYSIKWTIFQHQWWSHRQRHIQYMPYMFNTDFIINSEYLNEICQAFILGGFWRKKQIVLLSCSDGIHNLLPGETMSRRSVKIWVIQHAYIEC